MSSNACWSGVKRSSVLRPGSAADSYMYATPGSAPGISAGASRALLDSSLLPASHTPPSVGGTGVLGAAGTSVASAPVPPADLLYAPALGAASALRSAASGRGRETGGTGSFFFRRQRRRAAHEQRRRAHLLLAAVCGFAAHRGRPRARRLGNADALGSPRRLCAAPRAADRGGDGDERQLQCGRQPFAALDRDGGMSPFTSDARGDTDGENSSGGGGASFASTEDFEIMVGDLRRTFIGWLKKTESDLRKEKRDLTRARKEFEEERKKAWERLQQEKDNEYEKIKASRKGKKTTTHL
ncbi:kelch repeat and K+ channel tetramerization domain containing protein [Besnoitia besnoiti]|uniref:Kelch repeat and K+ channel tetramerization domain containing protein n=1 Tax=Besnoitia besnoiti TaxID=94643 RepID=A0A2A9MH44_BESBE|nr:kelch repeat and K+ channel tetramerization domain containing protein [Besnoitia besnoiti]PFH37848.1 kelch repeat and K+ channel tetramerization domain containing protein [Besnoitia besnoiti]